MGVWGSGFKVEGSGFITFTRFSSTFSPLKQALLFLGRSESEVRDSAVQGAMSRTRAMSGDHSQVSVALADEGSRN